MALRKKYIQPITEVCTLNTATDVMIPINPGDTTSGQLTNKHTWDSETLDEGLEDNLLKYPSFFPDDPSASLWE